ncbi:hypothetical protein LZ30DRAFT_208343 [Colletotrichum cereale]|nr:hypothetical protein LZ30DRAFT_208343 [Colletotrichum cereale]
MCAYRPSFAIVAQSSAGTFVITRVPSVCTPGPTIRPPPRVRDSPPSPSRRKSKRVVIDRCCTASPNSPFPMFAHPRRNSLTRSLGTPRTCTPLVRGLRLPSMCLGPRQQSIVPASIFCFSHGLIVPFLARNPLFRLVFRPPSPAQPSQTLRSVTRSTLRKTWLPHA